MIRYAMITDEKSKVCAVGIGTDIEYYKSIGMTEMDVEQCYDGNWYVAGYAPVKPQELIETELQKQYTRLIQSILDKEAYALGYTGEDEKVAGACNSVCTYVDTGVQKFDDEGRAFRAWRSAVWAKGYEILAAVKAGEMAIPTEDELVEMLPKLELSILRP